MNDVINFSDFFKSNNNKKLPEFNKEELLDEFFLEEETIEEGQEIQEVQSQKIDTQEEIIESEIQNSEKATEITNESKFIDKDEIEKLIQKEIQRIKDQTILENTESVEKTTEQVTENTPQNEVESSNIEEEVEEVEEIEEQSSSNSDSEFYKVYADKSETFSCEIELEGANLKDTQVRLVLESDNWNLMFPGEIDRNGKVNIPIRKLNILDEGTKGTIKMEVIAEGTVFVPWEEQFEVKLSKKVMVKFNENKTSKVKQSNGSIKVNLKK
jgi:hypothetical protein